jgi:hypothetical protein
LPNIRVPDSGFQKRHSTGLALEAFFLRRSDIEPLRSRLKILCRIPDCIAAPEFIC